MKKTMGLLFTALFTMLTTVSVFAVEGSGTKRYPYLITSESELMQIGSELDASAYYSLENDITLTSENWTPVAKKSGAFTGTFEGNGHSIKNLKIKDVQSDYAGLFYKIEGGTINNLKIEDVNIEGKGYVGALTGYTDNASSVSGCSSSGMVYSEKGENIGGLIGNSNSQVSDSNSECTVQGSSVNYAGGLIGNNNGAVKDCSFTGDISELNGNYIGGFCGYNNAGITHSYAACDITVNGNFVGGFAGSNYSNVETSFFSGTVNVKGNGLNGQYTGGLAGENRGSISECYSAGKVVSDCTQKVYDGVDVVPVGAFVGYNNYGTIKNCYSTVGVTALENSFFIFAAGLNNGELTNCYYVGKADGALDIWRFSDDNSFFDSTVAGTSFNNSKYAKTTEQIKAADTYLYWDTNSVWGIEADINSGYPYLRNVVVPKVKAEGVVISDTNMVLITGAQRQLKAEVIPTGANQAVTWTSSEPEVVSVDSAGNIISLAEGTAYITVEAVDGGFTAQCMVIVKKDLLLGDVNGDGIVSANDAAQVLQKALNSAYKYPVE